jgi:hypothetical protein
LTEQEAAELNVCFLRDVAANIASVREPQAASGLIVYLIGLKDAHRNLFNGIEWSTANVLTRTRQRAAEIDLPVEMLPPWYDVDDAETLNRLCEDLFFSESVNGSYPAPHTREFLESIIKTEGPQRICPKLSTRMSIYERTITRDV